MRQLHGDGRKAQLSNGRVTRNPEAHLTPELAGVEGKKPMRPRRRRPSNGRCSHCVSSPANPSWAGPGKKLSKASLARLVGELNHEPVLAKSWRFAGRVVSRYFGGKEHQIESCRADELDVGPRSAATDGSPRRPRQRQSEARIGAVQIAENSGDDC